MSRVLVFGDIHLPFIREGYIEFVKEVYKKYKCSKVVFMGDLFDLHRTGSRHLPNPNAAGAKEEYDKALKIAKKIYKAFPVVKVCVGNHDARYYNGIADKSYPTSMLKTYSEWTKSPKGWDWQMRHIVDGVIYQHGTVYGGEYPHVTATMKNLGRSTIVGHIHTAAGIHYMASGDVLPFAAIFGCGMDSNSYAAQYAIEYNKKPIVACGVVIDGKQPIVVPMDLGGKR